jgi:hypothetical protein
VVAEICRLRLWALAAGAKVVYIAPMKARALALWPARFRSP